MGTAFFNKELRGVIKQGHTPLTYSDDFRIILNDQIFPHLILCIRENKINTKHSH